MVKQLRVGKLYRYVADWPLFLYPLHTSGSEPKCDTYSRPKKLQKNEVFLLVRNNATIPYYFGINDSGKFKKFQRLVLDRREKGRIVLVGGTIYHLKEYLLGTQASAAGNRKYLEVVSDD